MVANYADNFTEADVELTRNKLLKANTRAYESLGAKLSILRNISKYGYSNDYIEKNQADLIAMTLDDYKNTINNYLQEPEMIYVIVGDKATQWSEVKKLGKPVVELDIFGNPI